MLKSVVHKESTVS